jgi:RNA polymerase sigma-70 factor (ECF subfamily)
MTLVERYHGSLRRLALVYVSTPAVAEEVVQDTWLAVVKGVKHFEARSSLKTWIFTILANCARTRSKQEGRTIPFSLLGSAGVEDEEPAVDPSCFNQDDCWTVYPRSWGSAPEERLLADETRRQVLQAIEALPPSQRAVVTLRDVEGCTAPEVCAALGLTEANQRVLLHRGRSRVRQTLAAYFGEAG